MTDQGVPAAAGTETPASPPAPATRRWQDVIAEIKEKSIGDELDNLERVTRFFWNGKDWNIDQANPGNPDWVSFAAFHDAETIRVYEGRKDQKEGEYPIRRLTLSKGSHDMVTEGMNLPRMIELMVEEVHMQALATTSAEKERQAVIDFIRGQHAATSAATLWPMIQRGEHLEDDDDDPTPGAFGKNGQSS